MPVDRATPIGVPAPALRVIGAGFGRTGTRSLREALARRGPARCCISSVWPSRTCATAATSSTTSSGSDAAPFRRRVQREAVSHILRLGGGAVAGAAGVSALAWLAWRAPRT